jgi:hypothetical protein
MNNWRSVLLSCRVVRRAYTTVTSRHLLPSGRNNVFRNLSTLDQNIVTSPYPDVTVPDVTLVDFVWDMVDKFPDYTALVSAAWLFPVSYSRFYNTILFVDLVFWVITPCGLVGRNQRLGGTYYLHLQDTSVWKIIENIVWILLNEERQGSSVSIVTTQKARCPGFDAWEGY